MRHTIVWQPIARDLLAEIWLSSVFQAEISNASDAIDRELADDSTEKGQSIGERFRRMVVSPLEIFHEVRQLDRIVRVVHVRRLEASHFTLGGNNGNGSDAN